MKICYIFQDPYPWDVRVEKIVDTLADDGNELHIICRNKSCESTFEKLRDNVYVHRLPKAFGGRIHYLANFPAFFSPFWLFKIYSTIRKYKIQLAIVRDLPLSPAAYFISRLTKTPLIMDMAEDYPAMIESTWKYRGPKLLDYIIRNPRFLRKMESWISPKLDGILVVSKASKNRITRIIKNPGNNVWVIRNTPRKDLALVKHSHTIIDKINQHSGLSLLYTGWIEYHRGLDQVFKAIPRLIKNDINLLFVIVGTGNGEKALLKLADDLNIRDHVLFAGWVDQKYIPSIISSADICIVPHYVTDHTNTTIPNKIYDYMMQKKPVIVSNAASLIEIVETYDCGFVFNDSDIDQLIDVVKTLKDKKLRTRLGHNGFNAIEKYNNWDIDKNRLVEIINIFRP